MELDMAKFQSEACRTRNIAMTLEGIDAERVNYALGLAGEAGELANLVKKLAFHKHPLNQEKRQELISEMGDVLWYLATLATTYNIELGEVGYTNLNKLQKRYPSGFSPDASLNRSE